MPISDLTYLVPIGSTHLDNVQLDAATTSPVIANRVPAPSVQASVETATETFEIIAGSTLTVTTATAGAVTGTATETFAISDNATLEVKIDGGITQTLTLTGLTPNAATAEQVCQSIHAQLRDATVSISASGDKVTLTSKNYGLTSSVQVTGGTARTALGFDANIHLGASGIETVTFDSGDFVQISAATAAEVQTVLNSGLSRCTVTLAGDDTAVRLTSSYDSIVVSGSARTPLGLPTSGSKIWYEAESTDTIDFQVLDTTADGFGDIQVYVRENFTQTLVYDSSGPTTATGWSVTESKSQSQGAATDDVWTFSLGHTVAFVSDDTIEVKVIANTLTPSQTTETYYFKTEDTRRPTIISVKAPDTRELRLEFSEPMNQTAADPKSTLYIRDISNQVSYHKTVDIGGTDYSNVVQSPNAEFVAADTGLFVGSHRAVNASNNGSFEILEVISDTAVRVDGSLVDETVTLSATTNPPLVVVTPYRLLRVEPAAPTIQPSFQPIVIAAVATDSLLLPLYADTRRYATLTLADAPTPGIAYQLEVKGMCDLNDNEIGSVYDFTSWQLNPPPNRSFNLWDDMIPQKNKDEDTSGDLERLIKCFDEVAQIVLHDVDRFGDLLDAYAVKSNVLNALLEHLGNPLIFVKTLSDVKKRDLIPLLVQMYKMKGTEQGLEDAVEFFIGKTIEVQPVNIPTDTWTLGTSQLGYDTYLGPSQSAIRYTFDISSIDTLTTDDRDVVEELVELFRPAHTHFRGFYEEEEALTGPWPSTYGSGIAGTNTYGAWDADVASSYGTLVFGTGTYGGT